MASEISERVPPLEKVDNEILAGCKLEEQNLEKIYRTIP